MWESFEELPVLIAEDSDDDLILLQRALRRVGIYNPQLIANTGEEALAILHRAVIELADHPFPAILFLDLLMPQVSGFEILQWLRDHEHPPITVVLHTGVEDESLLQRARDLGASFYLPKGVRPDAINEVFRRARAEWEQHCLLER